MKFNNDYSEFNIPSYDEWQKEAERSLKGKPLEKLISGSYEGIDILPIYNESKHKFDLPESKNPFLVGKDYPQNFKKVIDVSVLHNSGSNAICEIAYALDILASAEEHESEILFVFAINSEFFIQIAKLRAFRFLAKSIFEIENINILTVCSNTNKTLLDKHNNLLRQTSELMSSIIGGAGGINIDSFDFDNESDSLRLSENIYSILTEESKLADIDDPSRGSYFIDTLSSNIAEKSFELLKVLDNTPNHEKITVLLNLIKDTAEFRLDDIYKGKLKFTGVNIFPNSKDEIDTKNVNDNGIRFASDFEAFRTKDNPPKAYFLCFGESKNIKARLDFVSDFLAVGSISSEIPQSFESVEDALSTSLIVEEDILVICALDELYPEIIPTLVESIKKTAPHKMILVAGKPENHERYSTLGVDQFIHMKSNIKDSLDLIWKHNEKED